MTTGQQALKRPDQAPQWLLSEVASGLQCLMLLALPGTPAAETIAGTARAWADALWCSPIAWDKDLDACRIATAFRLIACQIDRFPSPRAVIAVMPERPKSLALPDLPVTREQRQTNRQRLADFIANFKCPKNAI